MLSSATTGSSSYQVVVGVDVAATTAAVAWMSPGAEVSRAITIAQTAEGFASLEQRLRALGHPESSILVVMEATGTYWVALATTLAQHGFAVSVINPAQAHAFAKALLKRSKTDAIDAQTLAQLGTVLCPPRWTPPPAVYTELYQRLTQREALVDLRQQVRNQLHALMQLPTVVPTVRARLQPLIQALTDQIVEVEREIAAALARDTAWATAASRLETIVGIGPLTATWLLVTTLNFTLCRDAAEATAYAGLAPQVHQSGTSVRKRAALGHRGNASLRRALYLATLSATQHNPVIRAFSTRLRAAGKPIKVARCAAARKLLHLAWAIATKGQTFDPAYASRGQAAPA
jgi:transposase